MRRRSPIAVAILVAAFVVGGLQAQHGTRIASNQTRFVVPEGERLELPFRLKQNHLVLDLVVQGQSLEVVLDTGMPFSGLLLFNNDRVRNLDLAYGAGAVVIAGAGGERGYMEGRVATGVTVGVGAARMKNTMVIVPPPLEHFDEYVDGIIGLSLFERFAVELDYDRKRMTLHEPGTAQPPKGAHILPLKLRHHRPYARVGLIDAAGETIPLEVVVDLGATHAISLNADDSKQVELPENRLRTEIGRGLSGAVHGAVGRVAGLELAGVTLPDVVATFPDKDVQHPGRMNSRNGNLGSGILKRFNLTIDYAQERIVLVPNRSFDDPFEWDMSGMRLRMRGADLRVDGVVDGSPAQRAGVATGDRITHLDGRRVNSEDSEAVHRRLQQDGAQVTVTLDRAGVPITIELALRRVV